MLLFRTFPKVEKLWIVNDVLLLITLASEINLNIYRKYTFKHTWNLKQHWKPKYG